MRRFMEEGEPKMVIDLVAGGHLLRRLNDSAICGEHPSAALEFLWSVIGDKPPWEGDLTVRLNHIRSVEPQLEDDSRFEPLVQCIRSSRGNLD